MYTVNMFLSHGFRTLVFALALAAASLLSAAHVHAEETDTDQHLDSCLACQLLHLDIDAAPAVLRVSAAIQAASFAVQSSETAQLLFLPHRARAPPALS